MWAKTKDFNWNADELIRWNPATYLFLIHLILGNSTVVEKLDQNSKLKHSSVFRRRSAPLSTSSPVISGTRRPQTSPSSSATDPLPQFEHRNSNLLRYLTFPHWYSPGVCFYAWCSKKSHWSKERRDVMIAIWNKQIILGTWTRLTQLFVYILNLGEIKAPALWFLPSQYF